jgi:hypothetical protein
MFCFDVLDICPRDFSSSKSGRTTNVIAFTLMPLLSHVSPSFNHPKSLPITGIKFVIYASGSISSRFVASRQASRERRSSSGNEESIAWLITRFPFPPVIALAFKPRSAIERHIFMVCYGEDSLFKCLQQENARSAATALVQDFRRVARNSLRRSSVNLRGCYTAFNCLMLASLFHLMSSGLFIYVFNGRVNNQHLGMNRGHDLLVD